MSLCARKILFSSVRQVCEFANAIVVAKVYGVHIFPDTLTNFAWRSGCGTWLKQRPGAKTEQTDVKIDL